MVTAFSLQPHLMLFSLFITSLNKKVSDDNNIKQLDAFWFFALVTDRFLVYNKRITQPEYKQMLVCSSKNTEVM